VLYKGKTQQENCWEYLTRIIECPVELMLEKVETETRYPCRIVRQLCVSQIAVKGKLLCLHERATGSDDSCYGAKPRARRKWVRMTR